MVTYAFIFIFLKTGGYKVEKLDQNLIPFAKSSRINPIACLLCKIILPLSSFVFTLIIMVLWSIFFDFLGHL